MLCSSRDNILFRFMGMGSGKSPATGELARIGVAIFGQRL